MKIQCNVCEAAEANVVCCADEAALCCACDEKVHAANKLASRHQRVPLSTSSSQMPKCDVCQEMVGYFFCLEDRALLCRKCDLAIHSANEYVSAHQRFLLTGAKVGPERIEPGSSSSGNLHSEVNISNASDTKFCLASGRGDPAPVAGEAGGFGQAKVSFSGESAPGSNEPWHLDEFFGLPEFNQKCGHLDHGTPKGDSGKLGESDCSPFSRPSSDKLDFSDCFSQVPETTWTVPQIPSPPTASGLYWPKNSQFPSEGSPFVPDVRLPKSPSLSI